MITRHVLVNDIQRVVLTDDQYNIVTTQRETLIQYALDDYTRNIDVFSTWDVLFLVATVCALGIYLAFRVIIFYVALVVILILWTVYRYYYTPVYAVFDPELSTFLLEYELIP